MSPGGQLNVQIFKRLVDPLSGWSTRCADIQAAGGQLGEQIFKLQGVNWVSRYSSCSWSTGRADIQAAGGQLGEQIFKLQVVN